MGTKMTEKDKPRIIFFGRWQPFHNGHMAQVRRHLDKGEPVAIAVRPRPLSDDDPIPPGKVVEMIEYIFNGEDVFVFQLPCDIKEIVYGREVGYKVTMVDFPGDVEAIKATEIRKLLCKRSPNIYEAIPPLGIEWLMMNGAQYFWGKR